MTASNRRVWLRSPLRIASGWAGLALCVSCATMVRQAAATAFPAAQPVPNLTESPAIDPAAPMSSGNFATAEIAPEELAEITVQARGPRFVSRTRRDQIGRIWAPVFINGIGPFRLVLDTGASHSGITPIVALELGIPTNRAPPVTVTGVTGSSSMATIRVDTLSVGDLRMHAEMLPVLPDAFGGAEGVLGYEGLSDKRISIDFQHDRIMIQFSRGERAPHGFETIRFRPVGGQLIVIDALVGGVATKAIIDTGGQATIANLALRDALARRKVRPPGKPDQIMGVSLATEDGQIIETPAIEVGGIQIRDSGVTYADVYIFRRWQMQQQPAILIGMDVLGLLDALIIDYRRHELQLHMAGAG